MLRFYLDTSAMIKRYLTEPGTECVDMIYDKAESGDLSITISLWNIGEVLGALEQKRRRGWFGESEFDQLLKNFADELLKLIRLKSIEIVPVQTQLLIETWNLLLTHHLYEADALQIATCLQGKNDALISGDENLIKGSRKKGVKAFCIPDDESELITLISQS